MFNFFDYVYYSVCQFYFKNGDNEWTDGALLIVALMHCFNILSIIFFINIISGVKIDVNKLYWIVIAVTVLVIDGIRYKKNNYYVLKDKWGNEKEDVRRKKQAWVIFYVLTSTVLCIGFAIYLGTRK